MNNHHPEPALDVVDLVASYRPGWTIGPANLRVSRGEIIGIAGPNGSGKSTFLRCIVGDGPRISGRVIFDGRDVTGMPVEARMRLGMSYQPQHANIFPALTVQENLQIASRTTRRSLDSRSLDRLRVIAEPVANLPDRRAGLLSGGDQQSLALAMAFAVRATVYFVDEPFAGLSSGRVIQVQKMIVESVKAAAAAAVIVEHRVEYLEPICNRILYLSTLLHPAGPVPVQFETSIESDARRLRD
jgi:lipopolysaccharide export system ATP-binding protein